MSFQAVKRRLGEPYYSADDCLIYNMDCIEAMQSLPDRAFDLTVTSPPYNIGKEYEDKRSLDEYLDWCEEWIEEIHRLTKKDGAFWLNLGFIPTEEGRIPIPYLLWDRIPFFLVQEVVWHYTAGVNCRNWLSPRNEKFLWCVKDEEKYTFNLDKIRNPDVKYPNQKKNGKLKVNQKGKNPTDVWTVKKVTAGKNRAADERTDHPAQYPVTVIARIVRGCSNEGELVFDPFIGSGTTAEAAIDSGRKVVGFEIEKEYCDIAANRLDEFISHKKAEEAQIDLFPAS